jgi:hypothetical protein
MGTHLFGFTPQVIRNQLDPSAIPYANIGPCAHARQSGAKGLSRPPRSLSSSKAAMRWQNTNVYRTRIATGALEHVLKKVARLFDDDMLQLFDFELLLIDHVRPRDREAL